MIRVLLVDDHSIVRDGLKRILAATTDLEVRSPAPTPEDPLARPKVYRAPAGVSTPRTGKRGGHVRHRQRVQLLREPRR